jgi:hypothetical protein
MDNARQQIVDSIKNNSNILVTVSTDPSVDELSAALGLTILLNNMDKRATAVFSGAIPPAINFLEPDKTFENTADSLRDFIIALDKEKADHLRYKVDGDVVKIFITPYRTTLTKDDLDFSQGDYNVELVIAIGVKDQDHLDKALAAHGKILHDAAVMTITAGSDTSNLGSVDWHDGAASSLSEMMVSLTDGLKTDKPLLDQQISSAFLTGIVSATERFSNDHTSSRVMTMAAQLMAAGANQQLIAAKLEEAHDIGPGRVVGSKPKESDSSKTPEEGKAPEPSNELVIKRSERKSESAADQPPVAKEPTDEGEQELEQQLEEVTAPPAGTSLADIENELKQAADKAAENQPVDDDTPLTAASDATMPGFEPVEPLLAPEPTPVEPPAPVDTEPVEEAQPSGPAMPPLTPIINEHGQPATEPPAQTQPINSIQSAPNEGEPTIDPFAMSPSEPQMPIEVKEEKTVQPPTPADQSFGTPEGAAALAGEPVGSPASEPVSTAPVIPPLPPLPPLPPDASLPPLPPPPPPPNFTQPAAGLSGAVSGDIFGDSTAPEPAPAPAAPPEPGQFKIPGQK